MLQLVETCNIQHTSTLSKHTNNYWKITSLPITKHSNGGKQGRRFWHATLRLHSVICWQHPPQRVVLSQICCFGEHKVVLSQILLDGAQPHDAGTTWLSSPVSRGSSINKLECLCKGKVKQNIIFHLLDMIMATLLANSINLFKWQVVAAKNFFRRHNCITNCLSQCNY